MLCSCHVSVRAIPDWTIGKSCRAATKIHIKRQTCFPSWDKKKNYLSVVKDSFQPKTILASQRTTLEQNQIQGEMGAFRNTDQPLSVRVVGYWELKTARMHGSNLKMSWEAGNSSLLDLRICYSSDWKKWLRSSDEYTRGPVWIATNKSHDWNVHKWRWDVRERQHSQRPQTSGTQTRSARAEAYCFRQVFRQNAPRGLGACK